MTSGILGKMARCLIAILSVAAVGLPISAQAKAAETINVVCAEGRGFQLQQDAEHATVSFEGRQISLERQPLPIGTYYRNQQAALVIDGDFVAFVPRGDSNWRDCRMTSDAVTMPG